MSAILSSRSEGAFDKEKCSYRQSQQKIHNASHQRQKKSGLKMARSSMTSGAMMKHSKPTNRLVILTTESSMLMDNRN